MAFLTHKADRALEILEENNWDVRFFIHTGEMQRLEQATYRPQDFRNPLKLKKPPRKN